MKRNLLLINPCYSRKETLEAFEKYITAQLPLSVGFISCYMSTKGFNSIIIDEQFGQTSAENIGEIIEKNDIMAVGISVLTLTSPRAYEIGRMIKKRWPDVKVVMGGIHVTLLPEESLKMGAVDIVVRGEGEITAGELFERIYDRRPFDDVKGISFWRDDCIVHNPSRELIQDINILPSFPFHLFENDINRYQFGNISTTRGCPFKCIFCSQKSVGGKKYRTRSPENVVKEIEILVRRYNQDFIYFNDDNFVADKKRCYELCDRIIAKKFPRNLKLGINARCDMVELELFRRLREAHFFVVLFGLETGSERIMKLIKKGETVEKCAWAIRTAKKAGFVVSGQYILGFPTETREESLQTIKTAFSLPLDSTRFNLLVPYPGTEVYEMINRSSHRPVVDWSKWATHGGLTTGEVPYVPEGRTARELVRLQWRANFLFYLRPKQIPKLRYLRYGMANQFVIPEPDSLKGVFALLKFGVCLVVYMLRIFWKNAMHDSSKIFASRKF